MQQCGDDLGGRELVRRQLGGLRPQPGQLGAVIGQPEQGRGQRVRVAWRDRQRGIAKDPPLRRVSEVMIAQPAAAPWNTLFGTTRSALSPVPKMPRQTWCPATTAGSSAEGTQPTQRTSGLAAAAARVAGRSWPRPIMVTSIGAPASRASAAPMTGVPCSGV